MRRLLVLLACVRLFGRNIVVFALDDNLPFKISTHAYNTEPRLSVKIPGDLLLGGLFSVHAKGDDSSCGKLNEEVGIHRLEAMLFALDMMNQDKNLLPNISVGVDIRDDCETVNTGLEQCLNFLLESLRNKQEICSRNEPPDVNTGPILVGVVGPAYSSLAIQVASLLRLFHVPQISYSATSSELSDKNRFDYFVRTVPPDSFQAQAIVDIIHSMNWSAVYAINSLGSYGEGGMRSFEKFALSSNICTVYQYQLESNMKPEDYDKLIKNFLRKPDVRVVVLFCASDDIRAVLSAAKRQNRNKHFIWLASDFWGSKFIHLRGLEDVANGAISIELKTKRQRLTPFYDYFFSLKPENNTRNPWFKEYWENHFRCRLSNTSDVPFTRRCHGNESDISREHYDSKVSFVIDAVFAFGHALNSLHQDACGGKPGICDNMRRTSRTQHMSYLYNVTFNGTNGQVGFDKNGDTKGRYDILQFRENVGGQSGIYYRIGSWIEGDLTLDGDKMSSYNDSNCGVPCKPGHIRRMLEVKCCWTCVPCKKDEYLTDDYTCTQCPPGQKPNSTFQGCDHLPIKYLSLTWVVIIIIAASIGLFATLFVIALFIKFMRTPLIMAAGRELSAVLLIGITLCYSISFVLILEPTTSTCIFRRFGTGFAFCLCYASLLVRTNRIARIFRGTKSPSFISPKSQLIITALILSPQIAIALVELFVIKPKIQYSYGNSEYVVITCGVQTFTVIFQLSYSGILIVLCTYYAFKTRKTPLNFNEAKFIGFCMYTTCVIWIAFLPMYYGMGGDYETIAICCSMILSATTILVFIFVPKVYIVLFKPEKNLKSNSRLRSRTKSLECAGNDTINSDSQEGSPKFNKAISSHSPAVIRSSSPGSINSSSTNFDFKTLQVSFDRNCEEKDAGIRL
ncbi:metabotropic glutamate receptor 3-like [Actinia tenebrosa]|uniref:Metabotropic glutamate receptor 3-like n=1 Tax=Actinia tenebrosa TaxID=6105 RepID=A0A6P8HQR5_ACTTE|nr:metabotropic glutamate receptor 3-like [Actinia tenebrosa]XP_031558730.1 metabotropic glutamate receptor 3-like [Actinia tenebrosa]